MNKLSETIARICIAVALGGMVGWCLISAMPRPLICETYKLTNAGYVLKQVACLKTGAEFGGRPATARPTVTATGVVYPPETLQPTADGQQPTATGGAAYPTPEKTGVAYP